LKKIGRKERVIRSGSRLVDAAEKSGSEMAWELAVDILKAKRAADES